ERDSHHGDVDTAQVPRERAPGEGGRARPGHPGGARPSQVAVVAVTGAVGLAHRHRFPHRSRITTPVVRLGQATRPADAPRGRRASGDTSRGRRTGPGGDPAWPTRGGWGPPRTRS